jgi:hypothetical protein
VDWWFFVYGALLRPIIILWSSQQLGDAAKDTCLPGFEKPSGKNMTRNEKQKQQNDKKRVEMNWTTQEEWKKDTRARTHTRVGIPLDI